MGRRYRPTFLPVQDDSKRDLAEKKRLIGLERKSQEMAALTGGSVAVVFLPKASDCKRGMLSFSRIYSPAEEYENFVKFLASVEYDYVCPYSHIPPAHSESQRQKDKARRQEYSNTLCIGNPVNSLQRDEEQGKRTAEGKETGFGFFMCFSIHVCFL